MEDKRKAAARSLRRCFECNRLAEELWATAFEYVWPLLRRSLKRPVELRQKADSAGAASYVARGA